MNTRKEIDVGALVLFFAILLIPFTLSSCESVSGWWNAPVGGENQDRIELGEDGAGGTYIPPNEITEPIPIGTDGELGTYTPAPRQPDAVLTRGEIVTRGFGGLLGTVFGNPQMGVMASGVVATIVGRMLG